MQTRFMLFDAASEFVKAAASRQGLVIVLDDLHWADASSLQLCRYEDWRTGPAQRGGLNGLALLSVNP